MAFTPSTFTEWTWGRVVLLATLIGLLAGCSSAPREAEAFDPTRETATLSVRIERFEDVTTTTLRWRQGTRLVEAQLERHVNRATLHDVTRGSIQPIYEAMTGGSMPKEVDSRTYESLITAAKPAGWTFGRDVTVKKDVLVPTIIRTIEFHRPR